MQSTNDSLYIKTQGVLFDPVNQDLNENEQKQENQTNQKNEENENIEDFDSKFNMLTGRAIRVSFLCVKLVIFCDDTHKKEDHFSMLNDLMWILQ